jgi:uncharacterized surface protein with fasciclin (FAS1) repeats
LFAAAAAAVLFTLPGTAIAANGNIVGAAASSPVHKTLVTAIRTAKLTDTLASKGPFTVFAPTDSAYAELGDAVANLLKPENRNDLTQILTYHVVPGRYTAGYIVQQINANGGSFVLTTVEGSTLTARLDGGQVKITDETGRVATVIKADLSQTNGVIHVTDEVFLTND